MSDSKPHPVIMIEEPPTSVGGILRRLGPGLIVAGSIVGSGELIATTKVGAEAGFWLLWLIIIGCVIKVFTQVEFGRFSIVDGETTMSGLNQVPGPRLGRGNWLVWYWFVMFLASIGQLGGIVGGVGQALAISVPLTQSGQKFNAFVDVKTELTVRRAELRLIESRAAEGLSGEAGPPVETLRAVIAELAEKYERASASLIVELGSDQLRRWDIDPSDPDASDPDAARVASRVGLEMTRQGKQLSDDDIARLGREELAKRGVDIDAPTAQQLVSAVGQRRFDALGQKPPEAYDARYWATLIAVLTAVVLVFGRYGLIQFFATTMVALFTLVTVLNVAMLQANQTWAVSWPEFVDGLRFQLPPATKDGGGSALATALATFGIIGVGASELVTYPYWCLEKGYARFTGSRDDSQEWVRRARGWMRVMRWDAWCSMVVYTFATIAFYMLGAAILGRTGLSPEKGDMVRTLAVMYEPVFGPYAPSLFLFGAFAVLYSTYFVANASHARVFSDALRVLGLSRSEDRRRMITILSGIFPLVCLAIYIAFPNPVQLVLLGGLMQAIMLPMLAGAALFFRYYRGDKRVAPGRFWDLFLWVSAGGMAIAGVWALVDKVGSVLFK